MLGFVPFHVHHELVIFIFDKPELVLEVREFLHKHHDLIVALFFFLLSSTVKIFLSFYCMNYFCTLFITLFYIPQH